MQATISSKYQVNIPKPVREHLNLKPKQKLTVIEKDRMLILIPQISLDELRGIASGAKIDNNRNKKCYHRSITDPPTAGFLTHLTGGKFLPQQ